jgi:hypothetical protein
LILLPGLVESVAMGQYDVPQQSGGAGVMALVQLALMVLLVVSFWKIFQKAGQPGWAAIVPIYNLIVYLKVVNRPVWWIVLLLIPIVNVVIAIIITHDLSKAFNKGVGWTIGMLLVGVVFYPMLAFGSDAYVGRPAT